jgi:hypothetical protein
MALLGGAAVIVLIVLVSVGGNDDESSPVSSGTTQEQGGKGSGTRESSGATGSGGSSSASEGDGSAEQPARERSSSETRSKRGARPQEQGRLGPQTGGSPAQGERIERRQRPGAAVATIVVVGGAPVGGVQRVRFPKDDRVRLIVQSDTDEVVEIPGYGLTRRVKAGGSARFYFETSKEGLFEIELTRGQTRIGVLAVG